MTLSCALTLAHLGSPEDLHSALSSEFCTETSLASQSHSSPLPSWQSPAQGKRELRKRWWFAITRKSKFLKKKNADWLDLDVGNYVETQCGKCHLRQLEIWGRPIGIKSCLKQIPEKMTLGILGNWRTTGFTQWGQKGWDVFKEQSFLKCCSFENDSKAQTLLYLLFYYDHEVFCYLECNICIVIRQKYTVSPTLRKT